MRKLLPTRRVVAFRFQRTTPCGRRQWSWRVELECGHVADLMVKLRRPIPRAELEILLRGRPYVVQGKAHDYEDGREYTTYTTLYERGPDEQVIAELLPPPEFWGCRRCPRNNNVLLKIAHSLGPTRECLEHGRRMCPACAQHGYRR